jgi:hypothetical protein
MRMPRGSGMTALGSNLYILSGDLLFKVDPGKMTVVSTLKLVPPEQEEERD